MPVTLAPDALEAVSKESWVFMFEGEGKLPPLDPEVAEPPIRDYALTAARDPGAIEKHKETIVAILKHDFDLERSLRAQTNNRMGADDLPERGKIFRHRLIDFLKNWCRAHL